MIPMLVKFRKTYEWLNENFPFQFPWELRGKGNFLFYIHFGAFECPHNSWRFKRRIEWMDGVKKRGNFNESFSCLKMIDGLQSVVERMDGNNSLCVRERSETISAIVPAYFSACEKWISYAISAAYGPITADSDVYHWIFSVECWCYGENLFVSSLHKPKVRAIR